MLSNNFTLSKEWIKGIKKRYHKENVICISNIYFWKDNNILKCQHFFDFKIKKEMLVIMKQYLENGTKIRFSYIDKNCLYINLKEWCELNNYKFIIIDEWQAPRLKIGSKLNNIKDYFQNSKHSQIKKNYKNFEIKKDDYKFIVSNENNIFKLWDDVLNIDYNSWKGNEKCDMKSLNREDLQYIFYLKNSKENVSLNVVYKMDEPLAYSLMFRANNKSMWYAVKWGASYNGRKDKIGFFCLFDHLEKLYKENMSINLDFWGRRSTTYDYLKNSDITRTHIEIEK